MIVLKVEKYCQKCSYFEARVRRMLSGTNDVVTEVACTNRKRCRDIYNNMLEEAENDAAFADKYQLR